MAEDLIIANPSTGTAITYNPTTSGSVITLSDDAFALVSTIINMTEVMRRGNLK